MNIIILGASGSIGRQTLDVLKKHNNEFCLTGFSVGKRIRCIPQIIKNFPSVKHICVMDEKNSISLKKKYPSISFYYGDEGLIKLIENSDSEMVVNALVGFVGLRPSIRSLELNKKLALANKESLVVGGEIINCLLDEGHGRLYPIDSEHSALLKCLKVDSSNVKKLILTASGGAFRNLKRDELKNVTAEDALRHPTWKMGAKITIDCATMVNKCFEIIEAHYLYHYGYNQIGVVLHDESRVHSMVLYNNGLYRADISKPDMRNPIEYALFECNTPIKTYVSDDYALFKNCHFHDFDIKRYPMVKYAKLVIEKKGTYGAVLNASNEVAVNAFLEGKISFLGIEKIIDKCMKEHANIKHPTIAQIVEIDAKTRQKAADLIKKGGKTI